MQQLPFLVNCVLQCVSGVREVKFSSTAKHAMAVQHTPLQQAAGITHGLC